MKKIVGVTWAAVFVLTFACSCDAFAQGSDQEKEYTRQREAARVKAANETSVKQNAVNNAPAAGKRFEPTGVFSTVAEREAAKARSQAARDEQVRINTINREKWKREDVERRAMWNANAAADAERKAPIREYFNETGLFNPDEVYLIVRSIITDEGKRLNTADAALQVPSSYKDYLNLSANSTYEETTAAILNFSLLADKAVDALDKLAMRFPEKHKETAVTRFKIWNQGGFLPLKSKFAGDYVKLVNAYPEVAKQFVGEPAIERGLYVLIVYRSDSKLTPTEILELQKTYVKMCATSNVEYYIFAGGEKLLNEYLQTINAEDVKALAIKTGYKPAHIIMSNKSNDIFQSRFFIGTAYKKDAKDNLTLHRATLIKSFARAGDAECGAIFGLRIIQGWTEEEPSAALAYFVKAVENITPNAKENLSKICIYKIKGLNDYCKSLRE